jgi:hypothetical protein
MIDTPSSLPEKPNSEQEQHLKMLEQIQVHPDLRDFFPVYNSQEVDLLKAGILKSGRLREKLLLWQSAEGEYYLLDGHRRFEILKAHPHLSWDYEVVGQFENILEVKWQMLCIQMERRNLTSFQLSYQRGKMYLEMKKKPFRPQGQKTAEGKTKQQLAKVFKVSPSTIERDAAFYKGVERFANFYNKGEEISEKEKILKNESIFTKGELEMIGKMPALFPETLYRFKRLGGDLKKVKTCAKEERSSKMMTFCDRMEHRHGQPDTPRKVSNSQKKEVTKDDILEFIYSDSPLSRQFEKWIARQKKQVTHLLFEGHQEFKDIKRQELQNCADQIQSLISQLLPFQVHQ